MPKLKFSVSNQIPSPHKGRTALHTRLHLVSRKPMDRQHTAMARTTQEKPLPTACLDATTWKQRLLPPQAPSICSKRELPDTSPLILGNGTATSFCQQAQHTRKPYSRVPKSTGAPSPIPVTTIAVLARVPRDGATAGDQFPFAIGSAAVTPQRTRPPWVFAAVDGAYSTSPRP